MAISFDDGDCTTGIPFGHHTSAAALARNDIENRDAFRQNP